jgi:hypothetical protein
MILGQCGGSAGNGLSPYQIGFTRSLWEIDIHMFQLCLLRKSQGTRVLELTKPSDRGLFVK